MKIIIVSILFTVQAQYIDDDPIVNEQSTLPNDFTLLTRARVDASTVLPEIVSSDATDAGHTWPVAFSTSDLDFFTSSDATPVVEEQQWFNVNQSHRRDPLASVLQWKHAGGPPWRGAAYTLTSEPRCLRQMCSAVLKFNGSSTTNVAGCLSFALHIRGQPVGQLWIVEDQTQDNISQRIQLTNKTLRIEHTLRSKKRNLSIETRILFRNPQTDALQLSNLNVNWRGPCPKARRVPTPSPDDVARRSTFEDDGLTTSEEWQSSEPSSMYDSTTSVFRPVTQPKRPFAVTNQKNIGWFLSSVSVFCVALVLAAVGHGLWLLRTQRHFSWHVAFDSPIQLLARRSIRSSTRSNKKIATISQIADDIRQRDTQFEHSYTSSPSNSSHSSRSTPISYYTYL